MIEIHQFLSIFEAHFAAANTQILKLEQQIVIVSERLCYKIYKKGFPWWLTGGEFAANAGDMGSFPDPGGSHMLQSNVN